MSWKLSLQLEGESYGLYLRPVPGPDEITWKERLQLSYRIFINEVRSDCIVELYNDKLIIPPDTKIEYGNI